MAHHSPVVGECACSERFQGAVAQLGERRLCKAEVGGSSPPGSTRTDEAHDIVAGTPVSPTYLEPRFERGRRRWSADADGSPSAAPSQRNITRVKHDKAFAEFFGSRDYFLSREPIIEGSRSVLDEGSSY